MNRAHRIAPSLKTAAWYAPAGILVLLVFAYPVTRTVWLAFMHKNLQTGFLSEPAGLDNLARLAVDSRFMASLVFTALFTAISVASEFLLGLAAALALGRAGAGHRLSKTLLLLPWTLPTAVVAVLWLWIFNDQYGVINALLSQTGVVASPVAWLGKPSTAMIAIIAADVWKAFPFVFVILLAGIQAIPPDLYEAIAIDGGTAWHRFRYITLPYLKPYIFLALIFRVVQAFAVFDLVYVLTGGGPGGATETVSVYGYYVFLRYLDFGYGSALVLVIVVLLALAAWLMHSLLMRNNELAG